MGFGGRCTPLPPRLLPRRTCAPKPHHPEPPNERPSSPIRPTRTPLLAILAAPVEHRARRSDELLHGAQSTRVRPGSPLRLVSGAAQPRQRRARLVVLTAQLLQQQLALLLVDVRRGGRPSRERAQPVRVRRLDAGLLPNLGEAAAPVVPHAAVLARKEDDLSPGGGSDGVSLASRELASVLDCRVRYRGARVVSLREQWRYKHCECSGARLSACPLERYGTG
mmetsp:Transcript_23468/g.76386  ORF Transcript_23468/g.76386 Transcript_23468/m.76386 type:complete len:223 (-) Transcript_23468:449-1117(-)